MEMWSSGHVCEPKIGVAHLGTCDQVDVDQWPGGHARVAMWPCGGELVALKMSGTCGHVDVDMVMWTGDQESEGGHGPV